MKHNPFPLKKTSKPEISLDEHGGLFSLQYKDIYAQAGLADQALEEKQYVFLQGNDLPQNWVNKNQFTIAETGFGSGLNFLNTLLLWSETTQTEQQLHYVSCELHPLNIQQLQSALAPFVTLKTFTKMLIEQYPTNPIFGFYRLHFPQFNVTLTLIFGDCLDAFNQLNAQVDAWYLDGFNPEKNPDMWSHALCQSMANLSKKGTTVATFSVARNIRDHLQTAGFTLKKRPGFGKKREMLTASFSHTHQKETTQTPYIPLFSNSKHSCYTILGAGIAGLSIAQKLQYYGKKITLIDRHAQACQETSGNNQAMIMPSLMLNDGAESQFYVRAFEYAIKHYQPHHYHACGVHQLALDDKQRTWQDKLIKKFDLPETLFCQYKSGLLYEKAGWLDTQSHAKAVMQNIDGFIQSHITNIQYNNNKWCLYHHDKLIQETDVLIIANGIHFKQLFKDYDLPLVPKSGSISYFDHNNNALSISDIKHIVLNKGYVIPPHQNQQMLGATFDHIDQSDWYKKPAIQHDHWQRNTKHWHNTHFHSSLQSVNKYSARAGVRVTTSDHMPICGPLIDQSHFLKHYHDLHHGRHWKNHEQPQPLPGLYILTGLGSRGFTSAPILAEFLCNQLLKHPLILPKNLHKHLHPNRFLYKKLKRKKNHS